MSNREKQDHQHQYLITSNEDQDEYIKNKDRITYPFDPTQVLEIQSGGH